MSGVVLIGILRIDLHASADTGVLIDDGAGNKGLFADTDGRIGIIVVMCVFRVFLVVIRTHHVGIFDGCAFVDDSAHPDEKAESGEGVLFGKLVHKLLEVTDWEHPENLESLAEEEGQALGAPPGMIRSAAKIVRETLESDLITRILKSDDYHKEVPFAFSDQGTIVEGMMDVVFKEGDRISVVDFKTDKVSRSDLKHKVEIYRPQVETYGRAVEAAFSKPPDEVILFFLHLMEPVVVP